MNLKKQVDIFNATITRKAVIRYLTLIMDFSGSSLKADIRPNRAIVMKDKISVSALKSSAQRIVLMTMLAATDFHKRVRRVESSFKDIYDGHIQGRCKATL